MKKLSDKAAAHRPMRLLAIALPVLVAIVTGGFFARATLNDPRAAAQPLNVTAVQRGDIEEVVTSTGRLQPRDYVDVGAQVSGQLRKIHVVVGSEVRKGDLLAEIDPTLFLTKVDASRAQLRYQQAQLQERLANLSLAESQQQRQNNLLPQGATTREAAQSAETALLSARAQIEMLKAQIEQTESTLRADAANLHYAQIFAPMDGTVVAISARQGQTINANQQAPVILRIADLTTMTVQTQVSEADVARLRLGMEAYFTTLGGQGERWHGNLYRIEPTPTVENNVILYNALFDVENVNGALLPMMTAQVFFVVAAAENALLVPVGALDIAAPQRNVRPEGRRATVMVVNADGSTARREVVVGLNNRLQAQILSGLAETEQVAAAQAQPAPNERKAKGNALGGAANMLRLR